jgi:DNA-binding transcriptional LysR family regulator
MPKSRTDLNLYKLEIFHWVAECKSFSAAAEHLSLRQPTVSAHIRTLEIAGAGFSILSRT